MIRFADYIDALNNPLLDDDEAAEQIALIAQEWNEDEQKIIDFYLDKYMYTLDIDIIDQCVRRLRMAAEILSEKADELERQLRPKLRVVK